MLELKSHQRENVEWIKDVKRGLLADQPGLGKSRSAIEGVSDADSVLIIAPKTILNAKVWQEEIERWGQNPDRFTIAPFSMLNDRKDGRPLKRIREEYRRHFDAVIVDEAHNIKGRGNFWTEAVKKVAKTSDLVIPMTGTPIPNWAHEVFTLLQLINPNEASPGKQYGSFWRWAEDWFDTTPSRFSQGKPTIGNLLGCTPRCMAKGPEYPCEHFQAFTDANFGRNFMRHYRDDCLDLPPLAFTDIQTPLDAATKREYRRMVKDFVAMIDGNEVLAWSQGAKNVLLDRLSTSPWLLNPVGDPEGGKFDELYRDISRICGAGEQVLVMAHYRDVVEACARVAEVAGFSSTYVHGGLTDAQTQKNVQDFKSGKKRVIAGSLETLSEGVTLTMANTAIFVERSYKPSRNEQATFRIHRMGQEKPCTIIRYISTGTVDAAKERLLLAKTDHQARMLSAAEFSRALNG